VAQGRLFPGLCAVQAVPEPGERQTGPEATCAACTLARQSDHRFLLQTAWVCVMLQVLTEMGSLPGCSDGP
jgi:hypothetical protein